MSSVHEKAPFYSKIRDFAAHAIRPRVEILRPVMSRVHNSADMTPKDATR